MQIEAQAFGYNLMFKFRKKQFPTPQVVVVPDVASQELTYEVVEAFK